MSAPLRPAACTRTSSSPACGTGSGCSWTAILPSRMVAARTAGDATRTEQFPARRRKTVQSDLYCRPKWGGNPLKRGPPPPRTPPPAAPPLPPLWRESRMAFEAAQLLRSPVWRGEGIERGYGRPVLLVPGFLAGDGTLGTMAKWLRANGYWTRRARIRAHPRCPGKGRELLGGGPEG